jgi:hypothetical protein
MSGSKKHETRTHLFPAGHYIIGDPCYLIADENWDWVIDKTGCFGSDNPERTKNMEDWDDGVWHYNGHKCFSWSTWSGDGAYPLYHFKKNGEGEWIWTLSVDAGLIGIIPIDAVDMYNKLLTHTHYFREPFEVYYNGEGTFCFGDMVVFTN